MKTEPIFGGKWLRVVDDLVDFDDAKKIPEYYRIPRVPALRIKGHRAPFGGLWLIKGNEIHLLGRPKEGPHFIWIAGGPSKS
jgi:hypothetical protein